MVQEFGKHPSQGTEDLPIRLQYHEGWMLTEALSGRDGRPSEISVCEWKHDWFHLLRCNHGSSTVLCAQSLLLFCALFWMSQDETTGVGFIFVWFVVFFLRNHKNLVMCLGSNQLCFSCCTSCTCKILSWNICDISFNNKSSKKNLKIMLSDSFPNCLSIDLE